jgi:protein-S-isoprenylcysteine O-methyltransferase Ste14
MLNRARDLRTVGRITAAVHFLMMTLLGSSAIAAIRLSPIVLWGRFRFPTLFGTVLVWVTGMALAFTVLNLAARGLGAPFAIVLSHRLTADWCYAYTRNPMVFCMFGLVMAVGCKLGSGVLLLWTVSAVIPGMIGFLRLYEERELELRFGADYLNYKRRVPMLWPKCPISH